MKKLIKLILYMAVIIAVSSCDPIGEKKSPENSQDNKKKSEITDSEMLRNAEQDSLISSLTEKIDNLQKEFNSVKNENKELKNNKGIYWWLSIGAIILSFISILIAIFKRGVNKQGVRDIALEGVISSQQFHELQSGIMSIRNMLHHGERVSKMSMSYDSDIESRLRQLENQVFKQTVNNGPILQQNHTISQESNVTDNKPEYQRIGYAEINSGNIFTKILDSSKESCVYSIKFKDSSKGEFTIISLDKIKSRNGWQDVVEYTGSIDDATNFKVERCGICEKCDDAAWQVTQKLKINLYK